MVGRAPHHRYLQSLRLGLHPEGLRGHPAGALPRRPVHENRALRPLAAVPGRTRIAGRPLPAGMFFRRWSPREVLPTKYSRERCCEPGMFFLPGTPVVQIDINGSWTIATAPCGTVPPWEGTRVPLGNPTRFQFAPGAPVSARCDPKHEVAGEAARGETALLNRQAIAAGELEMTIPHKPQPQTAIAPHGTRPVGAGSTAADRMRASLHTEDGLVQSNPTAARERRLGRQSIYAYGTRPSAPMGHAGGSTIGKSCSPATPL